MAELWRKYGVSDVMFYKWRSMYGELEVSEAKRLRSREVGNAKLKRLLADAMLDVSTLKEMLGKTSDAQTWRGTVDWAMKKRGHSQRRACGLVGMDPRVYRYRSTRPDDGAIRQRLRELAAERRRVWVSAPPPFAFAGWQGVEPQEAHRLLIADLGFGRFNRSLLSY